MVRTSLILPVFAAFLWLAGCSDGPAALTVAHPESLWSVERLAEEPAFVIDVRRPADYAAGHIPGARQIWRSDFTVEVTDSTLGTYGGMACGPEALASLLDSLGASPSDQILLYDGVGGCDAARVWWLLRLYGHERVALLDGSPQTWTASGRSLSTSLPSPPVPGGFTFTGSSAPELLVTLADVEAARVSGNVLLLDTRSAAEFSGEQQKNGAARAGHIPGAVHYDWGNAVDMGGTSCLKPLKDIAYDLGALGIGPETSVITYCHSGVRSAHTAFVLREILGYTNVRNYDGSWTEYSRR